MNAQVQGRHQIEIAESRYAMKASQDTVSGSAIGMAARPASEIESEVGRLAATIDCVDGLLNDLANKIHTVRADEPPTVSDKGPSQTQPMTPLGCQLRGLTERVEQLRSCLQYQLRTIAL